MKKPCLGIFVMSGPSLANQSERYPYFKWCISLNFKHNHTFSPQINSLKTSAPYLILNGLKFQLISAQLGVPLLAPVVGQVTPVLGRRGTSSGTQQNWKINITALLSDILTVYTCIYYEIYCNLMPWKALHYSILEFMLFQHVHNILF